MADLDFCNTLRDIANQYGDDILKDRCLWYIVTDSYHFVYKYDLKQTAKACIQKRYAAEILLLKGRKKDTEDYISEIILREYIDTPNLECAITTLLAFAYAIKTFEIEDLSKLESHLSSPIAPVPTTPTFPAPKGNSSSGNSNAGSRGNKNFRTLWLSVSIIMIIFACWLIFLDNHKNPPLTEEERYMQRLVEFARTDSVRFLNEQLAERRRDSVANLSIAGISLDMPTMAEKDSLYKKTHYPEYLYKNDIYVFAGGSEDSCPFDILKGIESLDSVALADPDLTMGESFTGFVSENGRAFDLTIYDYDDKVSVIIAKDKDGFNQFKDLVDSMATRYGRPEVYESAPRYSDGGTELPAEVNMRWHFANGEVLLTPREIVMVSSQFKGCLNLRLSGNNDVSRMPLRERNAYLKNHRKNRIVDLGDFGALLGQYYIGAEAYVRACRRMKMIATSKNGSDICLWYDLYGDKKHTKLYLDKDNKVYAICMDIYLSDEVDKTLQFLVDRYGEPEIECAMSDEDKVSAFSIMNMKYNPHVKEYSWHFKNAVIIMRKDYVLITTEENVYKAQKYTEIP